MFKQNQNVKDNLNAVGKMLQPSWTSGLLAIFLSLAVVVGAIIAAHYGSSNLHYLVQLQKEKSQGGFVAYTPLPDRFSKSQLIGDIPLLIFWMIIGLVAYAFVMQLYRAFNEVVDLEHELGYVHVNRQAKVREAIIKLVVRVVGVIVWALYAIFTLHVVLPYIFGMAEAAKGAGSLTSTIGYGALAVVLATIFLHLHVTFLRLVLFKHRVFG